MFYYIYLQFSPLSILLKRLFLLYSCDETGFVDFFPALLFFYINILSVQLISTYLSHVKRDYGGWVLLRFLLGNSVSRKLRSWWQSGKVLRQRGGQGDARSMFELCLALLD